MDSSLPAINLDEALLEELLEARWRQPTFLIVDACFVVIAACLADDGSMVGMLWCACALGLAATCALGPPSKTLGHIAMLVGAFYGVMIGLAAGWLVIAGFVVTAGAGAPDVDGQVWSARWALAGMVACGSLARCHASRAGAAGFFGMLGWLGWAFVGAAAGMLLAVVTWSVARTRAGPEVLRLFGPLILSLGAVGALMGGWLGGAKVRRLYPAISHCLIAGALMREVARCDPTAAAEVQERLRSAALTELAEAVRLGWRDTAELRRDPVFRPLHGDPRWENLLREAS